MDPTEVVCEHSEAPVRRLEMLEPREVPLGGIRAMTVRRTLPQRRRTLIGAWCFLDHYGPDDVSTTGGMNLPAHPHIGLQTISWLFSGTIEHRDSAGYHTLVHPGELNLMTAGSGISHSERSTPETTTLHGAQLWVALPAHARHVDKRLDHYAPPVISGEGWSAQVFIGELLGHRSPVEMHSPLVGAEVNLEAGAQLEFEVDATFEHGVLVDSGDVKVQSGRADSGDSGDSAGRGVHTRDIRDAPEVTAVGNVTAELSLRAHDLGYSPPEADTLRITAGADGARLLIIGGALFRERIIMWWNFVGRTHEEIIEARAQWQARIGAEGVGSIGPRVESHLSAADAGLFTQDRFGLPDDEPDPPLPAPAVPIARMQPRG